MELKYKKIQKAEKINSAMLLLHGYITDMNLLNEVALTLIDEFPKMGFYLLNAPIALPDSGYCWFNITPEEFSHVKNPKTEEASKVFNEFVSRAPLSSVHNFIENVAKEQSLPYDRILCAGFSQGGFMSLASGLTFKDRLGGTIAMSSCPITFGKHFSNKDVKNTPDSLLTHSIVDTLVPSISSEIAAKNIERVGGKADTFFIKDGEHEESRTIEVLNKISVFLKERNF